MFTINRFDNRRACGFTIVELIIFIVIVSTAVLGILMVMNITTANSADPQIRKQALSIAEALMEEASQAPFTYCNAVITADGSTCSISNGNGTRLSNYNGAVQDINGNTPAVNNYTANVTITSNAAPANVNLAGVAAGDALHIVVTVTNGAESVRLDGYRTRYTPGTQQ